MALKSIRETFLEIRKLEKETSENEHMTANEAKVLYNRLVSLNIKLIGKEMLLLRSLEDGSEHHNTDLFDQMQQEIIQLKSKLRNIIETNANTPAPSINSQSSNQSDPVQSDTDSYLQKQELAIKMIESLEWEGDVGVTEAKVRLNHLEKLYDRFVCSQFNFAGGISDESAFNRQLETTTEVQQKVISLETRLRKIIESNDFVSSTESKSKDQPNQILPGTSTDSGSLRQKHKSSNLLLQPHHPKRAKINTTSIQKSENYGQSSQKDQSDSAHISEKLNRCFKEQEDIIKNIKKLKKIDFSVCSKSEIRMYSELIRTIRSSFVENAQKIFMQSSTKSQIITDQLKLQDDICADLNDMKLNLMRALPQNETVVLGN